jgi:hypothetical protein
MGKILTVDEKTTRDTSNSVTKTVGNNIDIHLRNTVGCRLGTVSSMIMTAGEFKPVNGAPNLTLSPTMYSCLLNDRRTAVFSLARSMIRVPGIFTYW